jgi:hypothetical protein
VRSHPPPHDHPRVCVNDEAHVGHPGPGRHECQVGHPELVRGSRGEVAVHQVRVPRRGWVSFGGPHPFAAPDPLNACGPHQPGHLIATDVMTIATSRFPEFAGPIDAVVVFPELAQRRPEDGVAQGPRRWDPGFGVVVGAQGHLQACAAQDRADGLDPELPAIVVDEIDYFLCWRSSSAPKKLAARFRISLARLSSRISCSSSFTFFDSEVVTPGARPSSMST